MGNSNEKPNFQELSKGSKFSAQELKSFFNKFKKDFPDGKINRSQFEALYKKMFGAEGDAKEFCGLVFDQYDKDKSGVVDFKEFILTLSVASRGSANEKLLWAFQLYDRDGNGQLTHDEIVHVLTVSWCKVFLGATFPEVFWLLIFVFCEVVIGCSCNKLFVIKFNC